MKNQLSMACLLMLIALPVSAQRDATSTGRSTPQASSSAQKQAKPDTARPDTTPDTTRSDAAPRFARVMTNVQIELTLTDQLGTQAPEKKTVSMIVSSGNWGKIRSAGTAYPVGEPSYPVELNFDARPLILADDGRVQLELTFVYAPVKGSSSDIKDLSSRQRPSGINQSQTVMLTSGRSMIVSQAADPVSDRKVVVEAKATVLK